MHALVVDDALLNLKLLCRLLEKKGWTTEQAMNGREAVDRVRVQLQTQHTMQVIFMDLNMPVMNGLEAVQLIRRDGYTGCIVGLTGDASRESTDAFTAAGASCVLVKPVDMRQLDRLLQSLQ